jgi:CubicO group peptidase (beta-lactamase class C family)
VILFSQRFLVLVILSTLACAQNLPNSLESYQGTYEYQDNSTVDLVASKGLFAVLDDAKYRLKWSSGGTFLNGGGQPVTFHRDEKGNVTGFEEHGHFYRRLSVKVSAAAAGLMSPRPDGDTSYAYVVPPDRHDGISVGDIAHTDFGHAMAGEIARGVLDQTWNDVHSVLLYQHGKLVLEEYFYGYDRERQHQMRSATKSVVSTLVGIAIDEHYLSGLDERVLPRMKYASYDHPDPRKAQITLRDMLTMQSGLACNDHDSKSPGNEVVIDTKPDWVKATLDLAMINPPGTAGYYCSGGVSVVGRMVENATHMYLPEFAQKHLFDPLGISKSQYTWNYVLTNRDKEFSQIRLRPRDMLKLGILFKDHGRWHGRQVLSVPYADAAISSISEVDNTGYGYFWWHPWLQVQMPDGERKVYYSAAQGNGGQKIYILPDYDVVAVFTAGSYNEGNSAPNRIMASVILPKLLAAHSANAQSQLTKSLPTQDLQTGYCPQTHQLEAEPSEKFFLDGTIGKRRVRMYLDRGGSGIVGLFLDVGGDWVTTLLGGTWKNGQIDAVDEVENHPGSGHLSAFLTNKRLTGTWTVSTGNAPELVEMTTIPEPRCDGKEAWKRFDDPHWPVKFSYPSSWHIAESEDDSVVLSCPNPAAMAFDQHITIYHGTGAPRGPTNLVQCGKSWIYGYQCGCNEQDSHRCPTAKVSRLNSATVLDVSEQEHRIYCLNGGYVAAGEVEDRVLLLGDRWLEINAPNDTTEVMKRIVASISSRK